jgi:hypothetical protein
MMLLGIDWFVVEDSRRKAEINVLFLCEMEMDWPCVAKNKLKKFRKSFRPMK